MAVPSVREVHDCGLLKASLMFTGLAPGGVEWTDGTRAKADAIIWKTGFCPPLSHLAALQLRGRHGHITTDGTRTGSEPRLHLIGYGDWPGPVLAAVIGRPAHEATHHITRLSAVLKLTVTPSGRSAHAGQHPKLASIQPRRLLP
ncbi:hypothetical protein GCM10010278_83790 [Streptomyces melanogenes]|nr:hypothetical protein GCM10010278_83790 [Streptomyces melanogenes]